MNDQSLKVCGHCKYFHPNKGKISRFANGHFIADGQCRNGISKMLAESLGIPVVIYMTQGDTCPHWKPSPKH